MFLVPALALAQPLGDPMAPPGSGEQPRAGAPAVVKPAPPPPEPTLQGVITGPRRRLALIDGKIVAEGAHIEGDGRLDAVRDDAAVVRSDGERKTLPLHPSVRKVPKP
ncbi:MAG: hypothetical protein ACT4P4_04830 [Betaproteobacteria bacterium]